MSKFLVPFFIFVFFISAYPQEFNLFGPRAGIGYLNNSGKSNIEKGAGATVKRIKAKLLKQIPIYFPKSIEI